MSEPSNWPLAEGGLRILVPKDVLRELDQHVLSRDCYPTALGYYPNAQSHQMRRLDHDDYLLMYCVDGTGDLSAGSYQDIIQAGDFILLPPGVAHHYAAHSSAPWSLFWCHFRGQQARAFYQHIGFEENEAVLKGLNDAALVASFRSLMGIASSGYGLTVFLHAANQLRQIMTLAERLRRRSLRHESVDSIDEVRRFMRENLHRRLSLDELAQVGRLSKYHFNRKYKELTGYSPLQHFSHLKVEQACLLLDSSSLHISEIAFRLGYDDPLYFSRVFRKVTGLAPSEYRQSSL